MTLVGAVGRALVAFGICAIAWYGIKVLLGAIAAGLDKKALQTRRARVAASELARRMSIPTATHVVDADLRSPYGTSTLAAVACDFENAGQPDRAITSWAVFDNSLTAPQRAAMLAWAEAEILKFRTSSTEDLVLGGWHLERSGRWQLLAHAAPVWGAEVDYAATVTLWGPVKAAHASQLVERLREHRASLTPNREDHTHQTDVHFTFSAGSWYEAQLRAKSLSAGLGYPVVRVEVRPA